MSITHATIHALKRLPDAKAVLQLRHEELGDGEYRGALLDKLKSGFLSRLTRRHGSFDDDGDPSPLAQQLGRFLEDQQSFSQLSTALMEQLARECDDKGAEIDARFLFFVEQGGEHHHVFYLLVAGQSESLTISDDLEVQPTRVIDTGPSLCGIKVDVVEWKVRQNYTYLTMVPPKGQTPFAGIFEALTGFNQGLDKTEATRSFLAGVESFAKQVAPEKAHDFRERVVDYCIEQDRQDAPIDIAELSRTLDGIDSERFVSEMKPHQPAGGEGVMIDRRSLRRYVKLSGREKDLAISFSAYQLDDRIRYNDSDDTLVIKGLPKALKQQLLDHLKG